MGSQNIAGDAEPQPGSEMRAYTKIRRTIQLLGTLEAQEFIHGTDMRNDFAERECLF